MRVSILVLLETALILISNCCVRGVRVGFQSLFYWKLLSYIMWKAEIRGALTSFNPCFIGNCSHTHFSSSSRPWDECFNPCFIGNCSHTNGIALAGTYPDGFQSLFYWKLLSYQISASLHHAINNVSILVLLETALIPGPDLTRSPRNRVSILVLLETALIPHFHSFSLFSR